MTMTPQEIQTQEFHVRFRGFDVEEVDTFLEKVAAAFLALSEENKRLSGQLETLEQEMAAYRRQEKTFQHAILSAQQIADGMKEKSLAEAEKVRQKARREAEELRASANAEIAALEVEVDRLERLRAEAKSELRRMLHGYIDMLDQPMASPAPPEPEEELVPSVPGAEPPVMETGTPPSDDDLSDLYQRIELDDEGIAAREPAAPGKADGLPASGDDDLDDLGADGPRFTLAEPAEESYATIPDLDDDVVFSLEDPLDQEGPSVSFDEPEKDK